MKKFTPEDPETRSADILAENIEGLKALFPEAFTEGKVDFEVLKQLLGGVVDEREEKFGLSWHGKRQARQFALTPSIGTLRPAKEESVDWDTTQNLMIEGDNLEVLKLLQKSYAGKVKFIYIDPPYNTGKDFVYPDNYRDNIRNYLELTGQTDEGGRKITSNTEASGRFHTDWLNMMYPRLKLARNLLSQDGAMFISIGDAEVANLRRLCDDAFGEENFAGIVSRTTKKGGNAGKYFSPSIDFVLVYTRDTARCRPFREQASEALIGSYNLSDETGAYKWRSWYDSSLTLERSVNARYGIEAPDGTEVWPPDGKRWRNVETTFLQKRGAGEIEFRKQDSPHVTQHGSPAGWAIYYKLRPGAAIEEGTVPDNIIDSATNALGTACLSDLGIPFDFSKPVELITKLGRFVWQKGDIALDFFAGSGTLAHSAMLESARGLDIRYILVQLPEPLDPDNGEQRVATDFCDQLGKPRNIAELTKERLRRAAAKIREENPAHTGDLGFRVFKLDSTNIRAWEPNRDDLEQTLLTSVDHLREDRAEADILYELLLKLGLDLCVPIETRTIAGKQVDSIGGGVLLACLAEAISREEIEPLALGIAEWHKALNSAGDTTCVFRDSAFADDVAKTNLSAILEQHGLGNVRSL